MWSYGRALVLQKPLSGSFEAQQPFEIIGCADECPLIADILATAREKVSKAHRVFDDSEDCFDRAFAS